MSKTLALKTSERIWDTWTDRAIKVCGLDGLWEIRRCKGQNEVLSIKHWTIPPYRYSCHSTDNSGPASSLKFHLSIHAANPLQI
ncbi:hypothetical protein TNCV_19131 [Trichonephila clavipes]|nr:hypothetical protein TNCV_19131 [Trichonephila clavipes]